jgi:hypothetical protein
MGVLEKNELIVGHGRNRCLGGEVFRVETLGLQRQALFGILQMRLLLL